MRVAVILCTYNRCDSLAGALQSVAVSRLPDSKSWHVLVVDNNSTDETRSVVETFARKYPERFRYAFEPRPGKSNALNAAIQMADADILAFMDDDVRVEPDWLDKLTRIFENPTYSGSGGRIVPEQSFNAPAWLDASEPYSLAPLAMFDLGPDPGDLHEPPFGTNMAFRREVFSRYGEFRRDLGPQPGSEIRSEDTEFGMRLIRGGERLWYEPAALVHHAVPQSRVNHAYFRKWWHGKGRADIRESGVKNEGTLMLLGVPLVLFRRLAVWTVRSCLSLDARRRFSCRAKAWWLSGKIQEAHAQSRRQVKLSRVSEQQSSL